MSPRWPRGSEGALITMSVVTAERPPRAPATVADVMRPATTTVTESDHVAAATYLMHRRRTTSLVVTDSRAGRPVGVVTAADIARAVADGRDINEIRIHEVLATRPAAIPIPAATPVLDAAETMFNAGYQQLPVAGDGGLIGIVDFTDLVGALAPPSSTHHGSRSRAPRR
jgi:CBS domain-containing protein